MMNDVFMWPGWELLAVAAFLPVAWLIRCAHMREWWGSQEAYERPAPSDREEWGARARRRAGAAVMWVGAPAFLWIGAGLFLTEESMDSPLLLGIEVGGWWALGVATWMLLMGVAHESLRWFNRPRFMLPPHLRREPGLLEARRRLDREQDRKERQDVAARREAILARGQS